MHFKCILKAFRIIIMHLFSVRAVAPDHRLLVEVKSQYLRNLTKVNLSRSLKISPNRGFCLENGKIKLTRRTKIEQNKTYKWRVRGSPCSSGLYLKKFFL